MDYSDFTPTTDGFTETPSVGDSAAEAAIDDKGRREQESSFRSSASGFDVLVHPDGVVPDKESGIVSISCGNLADFGEAVKTVEKPFAVRFPDIRCLREVCRKADLFGVKVATLSDIPEAKEDNIFLQAVFGLPIVSYPLFLAKVREASQVQASIRRRDSVQSRISRQEAHRLAAREEKAVQPTIGAGSAADDDDALENFE